MSPSEDDALFDRLNVGDASALNVLLERARPRCLARVQSRLPRRRQHEAEDLVQTAFARAAAEIADFRDGTFAAWCRWLHAFVENERRDRAKYYARGKRAEQRTLNEPPNDGSGPGLLEAAARDSETPSRSVRRAERDDFLQRKRAEVLSAQENEALRCRFDEGLTVEETAAHMNLAPGTVKNLCSRAYSKLRDALPDPSQLESSS